MKTMTVGEVARQLELKALTCGDLGRQVSGAYASDMLSDVMSRAREGQIWLTMQSHQNVAAVATLLNLAAVVVTGGRALSAELLSRAEQERIAVFVTEMDTFEAAGRLYGLLGRNT
jgi:predicted transcriptional regulator